MNQSRSQLIAGHVTSSRVCLPSLEDSDDDNTRRLILVQLNKGETLHALRQALFLVNRGAIRRRHTDDQDPQGECLTLLTNAIVCWNTVYISAAVDHLRYSGHEITEEQIPHLSPTPRSRESWPCPLTWWGL